MKGGNKDSSNGDQHGKPGSTGGGGGIGMMMMMGMGHQSKERGSGGISKS